MTAAAVKVELRAEPCPDCDAHLAVIRQDNVLTAAIHHDDTCPTWREIHANER